MNAKIFALAALFPACVGLAAPPYQFTPIPLPPGATWAAIPGEDGFNTGPVLNESHQVALTYYTSDDSFEPYIWADRNSTALPLSPGFTSGGVTAINDAGTAVGYERDYHATTSSPVVWSGGTAATLDQQGQPYSAALAINDNGQIGGQVGSFFGNDQSSSSSAIVWNGTVATNLGNYGALQASVTSINNVGQSLITLSTPSANYRSALTANGGTITAVVALSSYANAPANMNNREQVIGTASVANKIDWYPFLWDNGNTTQLAPSFADPSAVNFIPYAIDDSDAIVGTAGGLDGLTYAALWMDGQLYDLNSLIASDPGWRLLYATDIADDGTIVGIGQDDGNWQAFLLTPMPGGAFDASSIPEPASLALLAFGSAVLLRRRRR